MSFTRGTAFNQLRTRHLRYQCCVANPRNDHKMLEPGAYPIGVAKLDLKQPIFSSNKESWVDVLDKYNTALESVSSEGELAPQQLHQSRSQLLGE